MFKNLTKNRQTSNSNGKHNFFFPYIILLYISVKWIILAKAHEVYTVTNNQTITSRILKYDRKLLIPIVSGGIGMLKISPFIRHTDYRPHVQHKTQTDNSNCMAMHLTWNGICAFQILIQPYTLNGKMWRRSEFPVRCNRTQPIHTCMCFAS